ncbi:glycosyltransferase family A protein [Mesorhizobium sp. ES1-1]|uniref:glycosyltransferase family A protein n=1 Tax=Mesorhizobium sp. ES1-1 TaxID=2876629 RepID=UPI001CCA190B|nr:glycosyltransferase family A protein [Mesorhizobium sp. ES1-1]MBZ9678122.1 glycosyltransferase family 2 protein [Mesorhizobium sp. ES1-1]
MHYFVMPLRSVETVKDRHLFSSLLRRTIENVLCQTVKNFRLILVCSERPELGYVPADRITVVETNLPIPTDIAARRRDMNQKIAIGAEQAFLLAGNDDFSIMKIDGDDLLAADLLEKAGLFAESNGFVINKGYLQRLGSRILWKHYRFHEICGSCASVTMRRGGKALMGAGEFADLYIKSIHPKIPGLLEATGRPLHFLPHWGAIYTMDHGDNSSGNRLGFKWRPWRIQPVNEGIARQFPGSSEIFRN